MQELVWWVLIVLDMAGNEFLTAKSRPPLLRNSQKKYMTLTNRVWGPYGDLIYG